MRSSKFQLFMIACIVLAITFLIGCGSGDVQKAKEFIDAGMYPQAIELLTKRISKKPSDAEAHFQLGICYISTGNFRAADERFASAVSLKSDLGFKIGDKIFAKGESAISQGGNPIPYFNQAVKYNRNLKEKVCDTLYNTGTSSSGIKKIDFYKNAMNFCSKYNSNINSFLCDYYFEQGKAKYEKVRVDHFRRSTKFGKKHLADINRILLTDANDIEEPGRRKEYLKSIFDIVPDKDIFEASIEYFTKKLKARLYDENKVIASQGRIELNENKWVKIFKRTGRDAVLTLRTDSVLVKYSKKDKVETLEKNITWYGGGYNPSLGSGKIMYYKEKSGRSATVYYWKYRL